MTCNYKYVPIFWLLLFQPPDYWVTVISLKSFGDGGILDLDDQLKDVADDREQVRDIYIYRGPCLLQLLRSEDTSILRTVLP